MSKKSIAIDGPSGAGKSTIARMVAKEIGFIYVDTGAIYRAVGLFAWRSGVDRKDVEGVKALLGSINIELKYGQEGTQQMWLNGEDVSRDIRLPEISLYASDVSKIPEVRAFLLDMQRNMAEKYNVIMDGRDIGTVVLPNADLKIFLTATAEDRAQRRYLELQGKGMETPYDEVLKDILYRDENDSKRDIAPLKPAEDSVVIDTTGNTLEKSYGILLDVIRKKVC